MKNVDINSENDVKLKYEYACNEYAKLFCKKHGYDFEEYGSWCGDIVGDHFDTGADIIVSMQTIRDDIDNDFPEEEFLIWYDYTVRLFLLNCKRGNLNFKSWCKGAPRISYEEIIKLEESRDRIEELQIELMNNLDNVF